MTILFTPTNLTPDIQQSLGWLFSEAWAYFLSMTPGQAMITIWLVLFIVLSSLFVAFDAIIRVILRNVEY